MKKICYKLTVFVSVISLLAGSTAYAQGTQGGDDTATYTYAVENMKSLGLMNGYEDGSLGETDMLKRSELAALLDRLLQLPVVAENRFSDVTPTHWAYQNIENTAAAGIFNGSEGGFMPEAYVKFEEAVKAFVEVLAAQNGEAVSCEYPYGYIEWAAKNGLLEGVDGAVGENAPRGMVAHMLLNLLYTPLTDGRVLADMKLPHVYYVAESGDDGASGTYQNPWKSLKKAAEALKEGETAICLAGEYDEAASLQLMRADVSICGRAGERVRVRFAENAGITVSAENVSLEHLLFVKQTADNEENDSPKAFLNGSADGLRLVDCEWNGFDIPVSLQNCRNASVLRCAFDNSAVGMQLEQVQNSLVGNCDFNYPKQTGAVLSQAENVQFFNNLITGEADFQTGVLLKSGTNEVVLRNNIIALSTADKAIAFSLEDTANCSFYNNSVVGGENAVVFNGEKNVNPKFLNNIFSECSGDTYLFDQSAEGLLTDYNLFYQTHPKWMEAHSQFGKPWFVNGATDWRINANSPAVGKGENLSAEGIDFIDRNGERPGLVWNIGAFNGHVGGALASNEAVVDDGSIFEDFTLEAANWMAVRGTWEVIDGVYMNISTTGRNSALYTPSLNWRNFEFSADVKSPKVTNTAATGLIFRADAEMKNQYAIRIYANQYLEFCLWEDDTYATIAQFPFVSEPETYYKMTVKAEGSHYTFYVDGEEVGSADDSRCMRGGIGLYAYSQMYEYDNIQAKPLD